MKRNKKFAIFLIASLIGISALGGSIVAMALESNQATISDINLESSYAKGSILTVPEATINVNGEKKLATAYLHHPNGNVIVLDETIELDAMGNYSLEYRTTVSGKVYSFDKEFTVYTERFQILGDKGSAEYKCYEYVDPYSQQPASLTGEFVTLYEGETLLLNDYFDIKKATKNEPIIHIAVIPEVFGKEDYSCLNFKFVNKNDPEQFLVVNANYYANNDMTYFLAGANEQNPSGLEAGNNKLHVADGYGAAWQGSFQYGEIMLARGKTIQQDTLKLYLDYNEKVMYANDQKGFIIDLDSAEYFTNIWEGFENGMVSVEISAGRYESAKPAQFMILEVSQGDINLQEQTYRDTEGPEILANFGSYQESNLPKGIVGYEYPCFSAIAEDWYSGFCNVTTRVYGRYNSSQRYEIDVKNGKFIPDTAGEYVIEYSSEDYSGNRTYKTYTIQVQAQEAPITAEVVAPITNCLAGENIPVAELNLSGGIGEKRVDIQVQAPSGVVQIENGFFRPNVTGEYIVSYKIYDFVGQEKTASYKVNVAANGKAVFKDAIVLPKYFIENSTYLLPTVTAYDYSANQGGKAIQAVAVVKDKNGEREISNGQFTPAVNNHLDTALVKYKAVIGSQVAYSSTYEIPVCKVGTGKNVDMSKYFVGQEITTLSTKDYVSVATDESNQRIYFANAMLADSFEITFDVDPVNNGSDKVHLYLSDVESGATVKVTYTKQQGSTSLMSINDGKEYGVNSSFYGSGISSFYFKYNALTNKITNESTVDLVVSKDMYGNPFDGFKSGKVYFSFAFENAVRTTALQIKNLCAQKLSSATTDIAKPKVSYMGERELRYHINESFTMPKMTVVDVLDANPTAYYSVLDPSGNIVTDKNGVRLEMVSPSYQPTFEFTSYGFYTIDAYAEDWNGRKERNGGYSMEVVDEIAPEITVNSGYITTAKVGDTVVVAPATATDNISQSENIALNILVKTPLGVYIPVSGLRFIPTIEGEYVVVYYAIDESGNTTKISYTITVEEAK